MSFSYVYGVALVGCLALFSLLNLMSEKGVSLTVCFIHWVVSLCLFCDIGMMFNTLGCFLFVSFATNWNDVYYIKGFLFVSVGVGMMFNTFGGSLLRVGMGQRVSSWI